MATKRIERIEGGPAVPPSATPKSETILGREVQLRGNLVSSGILRIEGKVEGEIAHDGDVIIGETGAVTAKIRATRVAIGGAVTGNVEAEGRVELLPTAKVRGDIKAGELIVAEGAMLNGTVDMKANEKAAEARVLRSA
jgi:cytoskeletal protein CcmA (bactofilin family)